MRYLLLVVILFSSLCVGGCSTKQLYLTSQSLVTIDWAQTNYIAEHPDRFYERNPLFNDHPSKEEVALKIGGAMLLNTVIYHLVPEKYSKWYFGCLIIGESIAIVHNYNSGVKITW